MPTPPNQEYWRLLAVLDALDPPGRGLGPFLLRALEWESLPGRPEALRKDRAPGFLAGGIQLRLEDPLQEDEFLIRFRVSGSGTGGQIPDVAHNVRFIKNLVEGAQTRGQLHESFRVVGYEIRNVEDMLPSKPRTKE